MIWERMYGRILECNKMELEINYEVIGKELVARIMKDVGRN